MPLCSLDFALWLSRQADVRLLMSLLDICDFAGIPATSRMVNWWVDAVYSRIGPMSGRWMSIELDTDSAVIFDHMQFHCKSIPADLLNSLDIPYTHLLGYFFPMHHLDSVLPFHPAAWFLLVVR